MDVLVTSTPGTGHVFPMVPVVLALRDAGHTVSWATGTEAGTWLDRLGIERVRAGLDTATRHRSALALIPHFGDIPPDQRRALIGPATFGRVAAPLMVDALRGEFDRRRPSLVVTEPCELAAPLLCRRHDLPYVTIGFGGLLPAEVLTGMADAVEPLWRTEGLDVPPDAGVHGDLYLHPFPPSFGAVAGDLPIELVRGGGFDGSTDDPRAWVDRLGVERPLVYVTFGTEFSPQAPFGGLVPALGRLDADVVITLGGRVDPASLPAAGSNVRIERFVPQRALLERASLVVSHAGSGTVLGAAARGVPQLCLPLGADQFDNAAAVATAGVGIAVPPGDRTADELASAMLRLLAQPPVAATGRVAAEIAAMPPPTDLVDTITRLAA
jgi:UDP:flavonoid glycosyltransferase YjiC (YdhE family)